MNIPNAQGTSPSDLPPQKLIHRLSQSGGSKGGRVVSRKRLTLEETIGKRREAEVAQLGG